MNPTLCTPDRNRKHTAYYTRVADIRFEGAWRCCASRALVDLAAGDATGGYRPVGLLRREELLA